MLPLAGAPGWPCPFFLFGQLCVALCVADGEGLAAAVAAVVPAVVPVVEDVADVLDVVDDDAEWLVAALATAKLPPNPTPSAPAVTAVPIMILPSLDFNVSASSRSGDGPDAQDTRAGCGRTAALLCRRYEICPLSDLWGCWDQRADRPTVNTCWLAWVASDPMPVTALPDGASALIR